MPSATRAIRHSRVCVDGSQRLGEHFFISVVLIFDFAEVWHLRFFECAEVLSEEVPVVARSIFLQTISVFLWQMPLKGLRFVASTPSIFNATIFQISIQLQGVLKVSYAYWVHWLKTIDFFLFLNSCARSLVLYAICKAVPNSRGERLSKVYKTWIERLRNLLRFWILLFPKIMLLRLRYFLRPSFFRAHIKVCFVVGREL